MLLKNKIKKGFIVGFDLDQIISSKRFSKIGTPLIQKKSGLYLSQQKGGFQKKVII